MAPDIVVRRYEASDLTACRSLWRELTERHREIYDDSKIGGADPGRHFDEHLSATGGDNIWVAVDGPKVAGMLGLMRREEEVEIEPLVVSRGYRGRGVGSALVDVAVREAEGSGAKYLSVRPVARNAEAMNFFREKGFGNVGHVELLKDLSGKEWKDGLRLHDMDFHF